MKTFTATIQIDGLGGKTIREITIKAKTEKSALSKAYLVIGDQTGQVLELRVQK